MKVFITKRFPFGKFVAINMFARLYVKDKHNRKIYYFIRTPYRYVTLIQHERSHTKQQNDLLGIFFYIWYVIEWFIKLFTEGKAYREVCFEREARANERKIDDYIVYIKLKGKYKIFIYNSSTGLLDTDAIDYILAKTDDIKYIEYVPLNIRGSLVNRKWGSWLKYVFKR